MVYENFNPRNLKNRNPKISDRIVKEFECRILDQEMERAKALMEEDRKNQDPRIEIVERNIATLYDPKIHGRNAELKESYGLRKDFGYKFLANYYSVMFGDDTPYIDHKVAELRDLFKDEL